MHWPPGRACACRAAASSFAVSSRLTNSPAPLNHATDEKQPNAEETASSDPAAPEEALAEEAAAGEAAAKENGAQGPAQQPDEEAAEAMQAEITALREEQEATNNRLLRTAAELQNVRRRAAEEQQRRATSAKAAALRPMLDVLDDLQRALASSEDTGDARDPSAAFQSLRSGVRMVNDKFERALAGLGVEPIEAEGQSFDETKHEAMMQQPAPEGTAPGTVLAEVRRGYRMEAGGESRVLRHSRVVVASEPAAGEEADKEESSEE